MSNIRTSDIVFNKIEEKILSGDWKPGDKITSETQLVKELNVSRVSVREAIEKMVALNILYKRQGGGTFVNDLNPSIYLNNLIPMITLDEHNYMEILEFRLIIEVESARLCAERGSSKIIDEIGHCYEQMIEYQNDRDRFTEEDLNFHMKIAEGSGNTLVIKVNEILRGLLEYHQKSVNRRLGPSGGIKEHKFILDAIKNRDSELAGIFMKRHIERTIKDIKNINIG